MPLSSPRRPLTIVQIVENLQVGGLERMAVDLAIAHRDAGHRSLLYCIFEPGKLAAEAEQAGIPVHAFHKRPGLAPECVLQLTQRLWRDRPHVVHSHNPGIHHYAALSARLAAVPVVVNTRHGPATSQGRAYQEKHFKATLPLTSHVACVSAQSRQYLMEQHGLPAAKSSVILNGIHMEPFLAHPAQLHSAAPRLRLGTVGRMMPVKAHNVLVDAFSQVVPQLPHAELRIVGGGPLEGDIRAQVERLGLAERVQLEGARSDIANILAQLDLFVFSSSSEGLPLVILEAMAAGLPIVSTRIGGVPEVAPEGEVAWYCPPGDASALASAIYAAALSGELVQRGQRARQLAMAHYSLGQMQQNYEELYRRVLAGSGLRLLRP